MIKRLATAIGCLALSVSACSDPGDDPAVADPETSASTSSSPSPSSSAPAVPLASGPVLKQPSATVNAPKGYAHMPDLASYLDSASLEDGTDVINLGEDPGWDTGTLDEAATNSQKSKHFDAPPKRLADVELDGETAYHLAGPVNEYDDFDEYGVVRDGVLVSLSFELDSTVPKAKRQKLIESVLATFQWR